MIDNNLFCEISQEALEKFGKLRNSEDDLSTTVFLDREKAETLVLKVLDSAYDNNLARFRKG
jgi:hypothetical protein